MNKLKKLRLIQRVQLNHKSSLKTTMSLKLLTQILWLEARNQQKTLKKSKTKSLEMKVINQDQQMTEVFLMKLLMQVKRNHSHKEQLLFEMSNYCIDIIFK